MSKSKSKKKTSQVILRVEKHEKEQFLDVCKELDTSAAREVRRFMREFVAANSPAPKVEAETVVAEPDKPAEVAEIAVAEAAGPASVAAEDAEPKTKK